MNIREPHVFPQKTLLYGFSANHDKVIFMNLNTMLLVVFVSNWFKQYLVKTYSFF